MIIMMQLKEHVQIHRYAPFMKRTHFTEHMRLHQKQYFAGQRKEQIVRNLQPRSFTLEVCSDADLTVDGQVLSWHSWSQYHAVSHVQSVIWVVDRASLHRKFISVRPEMSSVRRCDLLCSEWGAHSVPLCPLWSSSTVERRSI